MVERSTITKEEKLKAYRTFLEGKILDVPSAGFEIDADFFKDILSKLFPHQTEVVTWALGGGRRAIFCSFGLSINSNVQCR